MLTPRTAFLLLTLLVVCAATVLACLLCYQLDNKYTAPRPVVASGAVQIDEQLLEQHPVLMLVDGWEVYGGQLLAPSDLAGGRGPQPDAVIFIGQYGGF